MKPYSNATDPEDQKPPSFGLGSFVFAFVLAILFYLLVAAMVRHHSFRGGHPNRGSMAVELSRQFPDPGSARAPYQRPARK
jgi:hypothetical protein